ncbi:MAG: hypothetical protein AAF656_02370 [Planctomycetota bacterium]
MSKDDEGKGPDDEKNHDVPDDPEMKLQPTGPLLEVGNAYARQEQRRQRGPTEFKVPDPPKSDLEREIEDRRAELAKLQENSLRVLDRQHEQLLEREVARFDTLYADQVSELKEMRATIEQRIDPKTLRGYVNRTSGRAEKSIEALAEVSRKEAALDERRQLFTRPLRDEQAQERQGVEEVHTHERENLEREIDQAREHGRFQQQVRDHDHGKNKGSRGL